MKKIESKNLLFEYRRLKDLARKSSFGEKSIDHARSFCFSVLTEYWIAICSKHNLNLSMAEFNTPSMISVEGGVFDLARSLGLLISEFPVESAGYFLGSVYTVMLPDSIRSELGAYYTPPELVSRLIDHSGVDFAKASVIDPACGGGAFLVPIAARMLKSLEGASSSEIIKKVKTNLRGIELDPFAAWVTQVLLEALLAKHICATHVRLNDVIVIGNALNHDNIGRFDLVIGNPPYGRIKLCEALRKKYARSLYGHANLYGLFTDLALRFVKADGFISYLTPTSFLGGQYYKALRALIAEKATPVTLDLVSDRSGVFDGVLQETILATYVAKKSKKECSVFSISSESGDVSIEKTGKFKIREGGAPWIVPRSKESAHLIGSFDKPGRLIDLGYSVSTGQLVWNRHKDQLSGTKKEGCRPIIWAESVTQSGFSYSCEKRGHTPFIRLFGQGHLITRHECVILQRTTSKEQERRLVCGVIPQGFIDKHHGVVIENHLNIVYTQNSPVRAETVSLILNSPVVDRLFRCVNGSVAVSAFELESIPMPSLEEALELQSLIGKLSKEDLNKKIEDFLLSPP